MSSILAHLDFLDEAIDRLSDAIKEQLVPFAHAVELLCTIPGVQQRTAQSILAEIGPDMTVFPSAKHLASGPANARATIARPANAAPAARATAHAGSGSR